MLTNHDLVAFVKGMVGQPYWYGTCVYRCTEVLRKRKANQYPSHYKSDRTGTYRKHINDKKVCADCVGLIKGFFWTNGGKKALEAIGNDKSFPNMYTGNGMPDRSANGLLKWCKSKGCKNGKIETLPNVGGLIVHKSGHVGVYIGDGKVIEARGFAYGIVETNLHERGWTSWTYLPKSILLYKEETPSETVPQPSETFTTYTVRDGDTLWNIAKRFLGAGVRWTEISELNDLKGSLIRIGQKLKIPKGD